MVALVKQQVESAVDGWKTRGELGGSRDVEQPLLAASSFKTSGGRGAGHLFDQADYAGPHATINNPALGVSSGKGRWRYLAHSAFGPGHGCEGAAS
ncbi:MAG TPA: hypothetical protein VGO08_10155 [Burkholderiales bacterium]|nr:hypothetical protein [Burkholderiales bacterium]